MRASSASVSTVLFKRGLRQQWMQGVKLMGDKPQKLVGPAFTLRYIPAREDIDTVRVFEDANHPQRLAIESTPAGRVLVIDCRRDVTAGSCGSVLVHRLAVRGVAGLVSDGGLRDAAEAIGFGMPLFTGGACSPTNLTRHHAVDIQVPIGCATVPVFPGDVIVGDGDGVVVIPREIADDVAAETAPMADYEAFVHQRIDEGRALPGLYPANAETQAELKAWLLRH
jgi:regulator of RNase E activity RraA